ncbi:MAG: sterol desaturase family protein [Phycisphaerae bacterium]
MGIAILFSVFIVGLLVFHQLEHRRPIRTDYRVGAYRRAYLADFVSAAVNGPGLSGLEKIAFTWLVTILPPYSHVMGAWNWWWQFAVVFMVNDFGRYWLHRWYHEIPFFWRIHRVHHAIFEMDAMSVFRIHVFEAVIKNGLLFLPFRLLGVDDSVFIAFSAIDITKGFWHHANLRTYIGPLNYIFNSAEQHWWHHTIEGKGMMSNYGSVLSIWDRIFGTAYWPRGQWPERIGVEGMEAFPDDYIGQFASIRYDDREAQRHYGSATERPEPRTAAAAETRSVEPASIA